MISVNKNKIYFDEGARGYMDISNLYKKRESKTSVVSFDIFTQ